MAETTQILGSLIINRGPFDSDKSYYKDNVVQHNGSSYICLAKGPVNTSPGTDTTNWSVFAAKGQDGQGGGGTGEIPEGYILYKDAWDDGFTYKKDDVVYHAEKLYRCKQDVGMGYTPGDNPEYWEVFSVRDAYTKYQIGFLLMNSPKFKAWDPTPATTYSVGNITLVDNDYWVCLQQTSGGDPIPGDTGAEEYWREFLPTDFATLFADFATKSEVDGNTTAINELSRQVATHQSNIADLQENKQEKLESGTNIKTINGVPILGSGNIVIEGGAGGEQTPIEGYTKEQIDDLIKSCNKYKGAFSPSTTYKKNDIVGVSDGNYICLAEEVTGSTIVPDEDTNQQYWAPFSVLNVYTRDEVNDLIKNHVNFREWNPSASYKKNDIVGLNDGFYICVSDVDGSTIDPDDDPDVTYWRLFSLTDFSAILNGYATQSWVEEQGFLTEHQDISGKLDTATYNTEKGNFATKAEVEAVDEKFATKQDKLTAGTGVEITPNGTINVLLDNELFTVVSALPTSGVSNKIYLVPASESETNDAYIEYGYVGGSWERLGQVKGVNLEQYYTKTTVDGLLEQKADKSTVDNLLPRVTTLEGKASSHDTSINTLMGGMTTQAGQIESINETIGDASSGLIKKINDTDDVAWQAQDAANAASDTADTLNTIVGDKTYSASNNTGLARKNLPKKTTLTYSDFSTANTIYVIQYDYSLNGASITIPENCILKFEGGSLSNGTLICDDTIVENVDNNALGNFTNVKFTSGININSKLGNKKVIASHIGMVPNSEGDGAQNFAILQKVVANKLDIEFDKKYYIDNSSPIDVDYPIHITGGEIIISHSLFSVNNGAAFYLFNVKISSTTDSLTLIYTNPVSHKVGPIQIEDCHFKNVAILYLWFSDAYDNGIESLIVRNNSVIVEPGYYGTFVLTMIDAKTYGNVYIENNYVVGIRANFVHIATQEKTFSTQKAFESAAYFINNNIVEYSLDLYNGGLGSPNYTCPVLIETNSVFINGNKFKNIFSSHPTSAVYDVYASVQHLCYENNIVENLSKILLPDSGEFTQEQKEWCEICKSKRVLYNHENSTRIIRGNVFKNSPEVLSHLGNITRTHLSIFSLYETVNAQNTMIFDGNTIDFPGFELAFPKFTQAFTDFYLRKNIIKVGNITGQLIKQDLEYDCKYIVADNQFYVESGEVNLIAKNNVGEAKGDVIVTNNYTTGCFSFFGGNFRNIEARDNVSTGSIASFDNTISLLSEHTAFSAKYINSEFSDRFRMRMHVKDGFAELFVKKFLKGSKFYSFFDLAETSFTFELKGTTSSGDAAVCMLIIDPTDSSVINCIYGSKGLFGSGFYGNNISVWVSSDKYVSIETMPELNDVTIRITSNPSKIIDVSYLIKKGTSANRPTADFISLLHSVELLKYFDTNIQKQIFWNGSAWIESDGVTAGTARGGITGNRPDADTVPFGFCYFDAGLGKPIWNNSGDWVDASGNIVS